jgi:hypothetical protein
MTETQPAIPLIDAALRGAALALLGLLAAQLLRERPGLVAVRVAALLCLGLGVQLISSTPLFEAEVGLRWQAPLIAVSVGNAVLFWVFVQSLFNDEFRLRPLHVLLWCGAAGVSLLNCLLAASGAASPLLPYTHGLQRAMPLVFTVLSAAAAAAHWRGDLVERRRRLRLFVVVAGGLYATAMLALRLTSPQGRLSSAAALLDAAWLLLILAALAAAMLGLRPLELLPVEAAPPPQPPLSGGRPDAHTQADAAERAQAEALLARVRAERLYAAEALSLASLAAPGPARIPPAPPHQPAAGPSQLQRLRERPAPGRRQRGPERPGAPRAAGAEHCTGGGLSVHRAVQPRLQGGHGADAERVQAGAPGGVGGWRGAISRRFLKPASRKRALHASARRRGAAAASSTHRGQGPSMWRKRRCD